MPNLKIRFFVILALAGLLTGCASGGRFPGTAGTPSGSRSAEVVSRLHDANSALDAATEQSSSFYSQLGKAMEEIKEFQAIPGWGEFEQILLEYPELRDPDNDIEVTAEMEARLSDWGSRWNHSWEETLVRFLGLVDKCIILEARRLAVRERLLAVQAKYLAAAMIELSAGREEQGKEIWSVVEVLDNSGAELNSYQVDDI
ncbi:MAG: hypothetical protein AAGU11_22585, partial [Syntrophobacteraceae bacterium]